MFMENNNWYVIADLEGFVNAARKLVFNSFGKNEEASQDEIEKLLDCSTPEAQEELDRSLSYEESEIIVKTILKINKGRYIVNDDNFIKLLELLNDRLVSNILNNLANMGLVESAFDSDSNDFIFWIKDEYKEEVKKIIENPETD